MHNENLLKMSLEPFFHLKCNLEKLCRSSDSEIVCMLNLLTLYYAKLLDSEEIFQFIIEDTSVVWKAYRSHSVSDVYIERHLRDLFELMLNTLPRWSSFRFEKIELDKVEEITGVPWSQVVKMKRREKNKLISSYLKAVGDVETWKLFRAFQKVFVDSLDYSYGRRVIVLRSKRVFKYLDFAATHPDEINKKFGKEHDKILRALSVIRNLLNDKEQESVLALKQDYMIAVHYGTSSGETHSLGNMNWNVFMSMYILERLLDLADSLFDF